MKHYTYAHILPDGRYFYIGKGSIRRATAVKNRSKYWHAVADGIEYTVQILAQWETEAEAYEHEKFLIACFRDLGHPLVNKTAGGSHSEETKARWQDSEYRVHHIAAAKARWQNPEFRARMGAVRKALWQDPEFRARMIAAAKARCQKPEHHARMIAANKARWQAPR